MMRRLTRLEDHDRCGFLATIEFLKARLAESATVEWALGLKPERSVERASCKNR